MDCYTNNFPGLPSLKKLAADKHVIAELPLVPFVIINLTRLTVGVCMKVRFKSKVTRGFSLSPLRDSRSPLRGSLTWGKIKKNLWDQGTSHVDLCIILHLELLRRMLNCSFADRMCHLGYWIVPLHGELSSCMLHYRLECMNCDH